MEFLHLEAEDYESALRKARQTWGSAVRVHTRRDIVTKRGIRGCEISFYLVDLDAKKRFDGRSHLSFLLAANGIDSELSPIKALVSSIDELEHMELEVRLIEALFANINYAEAGRRGLIHLVGSQAFDAAHALARHYRDREAITCALLCERVVNSDGVVGDDDVPIYDATGGLQSVDLDAYETVLLVGSDSWVFEHWGGHHVYTIAVTSIEAIAQAKADGLLVTDLDTASKAGQLLSHLADCQIAFAYTLDGDGVVHPADASLLLSLLEGFSLDVQALSFS